MLIIEPSGRCGNNILQLLNCIYINLNQHNHHKIELSKWKENTPEILKQFPVIMEFEEFKTKDKESTIIKDNFWDIEVPTAEAKDIFKKYINPYIDLSEELFIFNKRTINFDTDLIIHIRSGDIFEPTFDINRYIQPPYSFYKRIFENKQFEHIYILTEPNYLNPVIAKILENNQNVTLLCHNTLKVDFKIMLLSKYFVNSNSTLSLVINSISKKEMIYYSSYTAFFTDSSTTFLSCSDPRFENSNERDEYLLNC